MNYQLFVQGAVVIATIGLYSVLYRENKLFRFFEHMFLGLAVGYAVVAMWTETLYVQWWLPMTGSIDRTTGHMTSVGYWIWAGLLPISLLGYFVFNRKYNWLSRIPIGIIIGFTSGQLVKVWFTQYGPQMNDSVKQLAPTTTSLFRPDTSSMAGPNLAAVNGTVYVSQAINNWIFTITLLCAISYFLYSFEVKWKAMNGMQTLGRWLLMIGFGAIFGNTVMMRFSLLIDRMHYIFIEFLKQGIFHK